MYTKFAWKNLHLAYPTSNLKRAQSDLQTRNGPKVTQELKMEQT